MESLPSTQAWRDAVTQIVNESSTRLVEFVPSLIGALAILLLGFLFSKLVELAVARMLRSVGLDRAATRLHVDGVLDRAGMRTLPSSLISRLLFWLLMVTFLLSSAETLGFQAVSATIDKIVAFLPNLASAAVTLFAGLIFARFAGSVVESARPVGIPGTERIGFMVTLVLSGLVVVFAVELLGVDTDILIFPLTAIMTAAALSAGLAFALGAYPIVTHILAGHFLKASLPRDVFVEVGGGRGIVERIGATETLLRDGDAAFSVPNAQLLDLVVKR